VGGLLRRLQPAGLRWRLAGWVALVTVACTLVAFVAVYSGTASDVRRQIDQELRGNARDLAVVLQQARDEARGDLVEAATSYVGNRPFGPTSTLLFARLPGYGIVSNRPELFPGHVADEHESAPTELREARLAAALLSARSGFTTMQAEDIGHLRLFKQTVALRGHYMVAIGVGESLRAVSQAQEGAARAFILAGLLALAAALLGAYLIGTRVSRPLREMASVAARVDGGDLHPRIGHSDDETDEVRVLADAFNHMLDRLGEAFAGQQAFIADASHELRTPLTIIRGQLEVLAAQPDPSPEELRRVERVVRAEIARISRLVDDLLLLAKTEQTQFLRPEQIDLPSYVSELWDGLSLIAERRFELGELPAGTLRADPDRLAQALRNLIANAIDHTSSPGGLVRLSVERVRPGAIRFTVEDDGPGIPADQRERVFNRFHRTDSARTRSSGGTGLGLAIVRAIAVAHGGSVRAGISPEGGARLDLELPGFAPEEARPRAPAREAEAGALTP
jgi:two-component system OmpR family sensor kinase